LGFRLFDAAAQLVVELSLLLDGGEDRRPSRIQLDEVLVAIPDVPELHLVQLTGGLLPIAGDEGDGVPLRQQLEGGSNLRRSQPQLGSDPLGVHVRSAHPAAPARRAKRTPARAPTMVDAICNARSDPATPPLKVSIASPASSPTKRFRPSQTTTDSNPIASECRMGAAFTRVPTKNPATRKPTINATATPIPSVGASG